MNERIKEFREKMGLSQEALGKALGIGRSAVSRIESERMLLPRQISAFCASNIM